MRPFRRNTDLSKEEFDLSTGNNGLVNKLKPIAHGASPQIPGTAYFGVSFMHTGGVLGVYNARVLLEGTNDEVLEGRS